MAGTIPLSMTQQLDEFGKPLAGGHLYLIQAGTTSTPQNGFQDSALTLPLPNPIILDASGRLPQFFLADGSIKVRLTDVNGVEKLVADGLIVTGASSGGGGGSPVDPTTILQTGWLQAIYGVGVVSGFVRCNARTIGSAVSGASERANADTQALFSFLWNGDPNLVVSTGRGASAAADWAANKTITLPDLRGRAIIGLADMGNSVTTALTAAGFGNAVTTLGSAGGNQLPVIGMTNLPASPAPVSVPYQATINGGANRAVAVGFGAAQTNILNGGGASIPVYTIDKYNVVDAATITGNTANLGSATPLPTVTPGLLASMYLKL